MLNLQLMALNLYLVDVRENRKLRSNARTLAGVVDGDVTFLPAPARVDCHYLVTAWSPAQPGPAVEPTADEHALIYEAMAALVNNAPFHPNRIYGVPLRTEDAPRIAEITQGQPRRRYGLRELVGGESVMFAATGITGSEILAGVRFRKGGARTHSIVMRQRSGTIRLIQTQHHFERKPMY